jgi:hypothetical protein
MNKVLMSLLFSAFILTGTSFAQTPPPVGGPAEAPVATVKPEHREHHPEIHKAMHKLKAAKADLEKASHDYAGHRVAAIKLIDQAMDELKQALEVKE